MKALLATIKSRVTSLIIENQKEYRKNHKEHMAEQLEILSKELNKLEEKLKEEKG